MVLFQFVTLYAQSVPFNKIPNSAVIRYYPLDDTNVNDIKNNNDGTKHGSFQAVQDRWGKPTGALQINNNNSYIELPNFFEGADITNGYSVSFWMKVDDPMGAPLDSDFPYFHTDRRDQIFFARKGSITTGKTLFGMRRIRDRLVVNRYIPNQNPTAELEFWLWNPANLIPFHNSDGTDWHFVTLVYTKNSMQVYVGTPNGNFECRANYFAPQNLSEATLWGLGNPDGSSIKYLDEFTVYSVPITELQAKDLFETNWVNSLDELAGLTPTEITPGNYYLVNNQDQCMIQGKGDSISWQTYKDSNGNPKWTLCNKVEVTDENVQGDASTQYDRVLKLKGKMKYVGIDKDHFRIMPLLGSKGTEVANHGLVALEMKAILKPYKIDGTPTDDGQMSVALTEDGKGSFPYRFIDVGTTKKSPSSKNGRVAHSVSAGTIIGGVLGGGLAVGLTYGIYKYVNFSISKTRALSNEVSIELEDQEQLISNQGTSQETEGTQLRQRVRTSNVNLEDGCE